MKKYYNIEDYNNEICEYNDLSLEDRSIITRNDIIMLIDTGNDIILTENEVHTIIENKKFFKDIISLDCKEFYDDLCECTNYKFNKK